MSFAAKFSRWVDRKTLKRQYAFGIAIVWLVMTVKIFIFADAATVTALETPYGTLTTAAVLLVGYAIGLQQYANMQHGGASEPAQRGGSSVSD